MRGIWFERPRVLYMIKDQNSFMNYSKQEFEHLFKDSYPHMYRMAFSMVENADDAKDAVHQVFVQIWKRKPQVADDGICGYLQAATLLN